MTRSDPPIVDPRAARGKGELAGLLDVTRQAVTKHLGLLAEVGLVVSDRVGRETRYQLTPEPMSEALTWMADVGSQWDDRFAGLAVYLATGESRPRHRPFGFTPPSAD